MVRPGLRAAHVGRVYHTVGGKSTGLLLGHCWFHSLAWTTAIAGRGDYRKGFTHPKPP